MTPATDYPELRKLHLLKAMGISAYVPRFQLPGAAPSRTCAWPTPTATASRSSPGLGPEAGSTSPNPGAMRRAVTRDEAPAPLGLHPEHQAQQVSPADGLEDAAPRSRPRVDLRAEVEERATSQENLPASAPVPPVSDASTTQAPVLQPQASPTAALEAQQVPAFQALLSPVNSQLAVLSLLPALASPRLQERERLLLNNILRWLGLGEVSVQAPHVFRWPLPGIPAHTRTEAGQGMRAFLDQAAKDFGCRQILVFGELLQECLQHCPAPGQDLDLIATYSLSELLSVPQLKRETWQTLLPLFAELSKRRAPG